MPIIEIETKIKSNIDLCFDLSRSIDLHRISTANTNEKAIRGKTSGLISLGEFVTWEATHFGVTQTLTSKITEYKKPLHFRDEQVKGVFKYIHHDHYFETSEGVVIMRDLFKFESPFGILGKIFNTLILTKYMTKLLINRNKVIKDYAETDKWKTVINE